MRSHDTLNTDKFGWFLGKDLHSTETYREDWKELAREDIEHNNATHYKERASTISKVTR